MQSVERGYESDATSLSTRAAIQGRLFLPESAGSSEEAGLPASTVVMPDPSIFTEIFMTYPPLVMTFCSSAMQA